MTQKLLTLPFRLGFGAARTAFDISAKTLDVSTTLARIAIETVRPSSHDSEARTDHESADRPSDARAQTAQRERPVPQDPRTNGHSTAAPPGPIARPAATTPPAPPAPVTPPEEQPPTPLSHEQEVVKTLEDEEELVAEFAEPGAEDGAGAQLEVDEPWEGYARMNAGAVIGRIEQADPAQLALLELYEQTHKKRQTVLAAANRRLRALSPPEPTPEAE